MQWLNWLVPWLLGGLLMVAGALINLYKDVAIMKMQLEELGRQNTLRDEKIGEQAKELADQGKLLAKIDQNLENIGKTVSAGFERLEKLGRP